MSIEAINHRMNERIKELAEQNGFIHSWQPPGEQNDKLKMLEKFAELLVSECIQVVDGMADPEEHSDRYVWALYNASEKIKEHFGVETRRSTSSLCDCKAQVSRRSNTVTTLLEASRMALEALESAKNNHGKLLLSDPPQDAWRFHRVDDAVSASITALRQTIKQAEQQEPLEYWNAVEGWVKIDEVREHFDMVGCGTIYKTAGEGRAPLYTAPPQRQPLTEEEIINHFHANVDTGSLLSFADGVRYAEAAHGIKENT